MKKLLLLIFLLNINLLIFSQISTRIATYENIRQKLNSEKNFIEKENTSQYVCSKPRHMNLKKLTNLDVMKKYYIGSSGNVNTLLRPTFTCLTANQKTNTIMFTFRANPRDIYNSINGNILSSYTTDGGVNWKMIDITGSDKVTNRFPAGVIYNPKNNTDPLKSYSVISGPTINGTIAWTSNYTGSARLDSTHFDVNYVPIKTLHEYFPGNSMTSCDDGKIHVMGYNYTEYATDTVLSAIINTGTFNSADSTFNWTNDSIQQTFYRDSLYAALPNTAWSQDGKTGYIYFIGIDRIYNHGSYMPIIYKSIDSGYTWNQLPDFDFGKLTAITSRIWSADTFTTYGHKKYPNFSYENDGVVDTYGNLHIFGIIHGKISKGMDSINRYFIHDNNIFEVFTKSSGGWGAQFIDTIKSGVVTADESKFGTGSLALGWDHRVQTSRTEDGKKIFAIWTDTDLSSFGGTDNFFPDIIAYGEDVTTGLKTTAKNFTINSTYFGNNFWNYASNITVVDTTKYRIPITTAETGSTPDDSIAHYFLTGVYFEEGDFVMNPSVREISDVNFKVSQNFPNPYKDLTSVKVTLSKPSNLSLEVRNLLGQEVYKIPQHYFSGGEHLLSIVSSDLQPGIYFFTVRVGQNSVSRKMVIR